VADADIIQFPTRTVTTSSAIPSDQLHRVDVRTRINSDSVPRQQTLTVDELYADLDAGQSILAAAIILLDEAETKLIEATAAADSGDLITADDATQRFQALLPELFCCRSLGDSFATVINALFHGLKNLNGLPVREAQIAQILISIRVLRRRPFLEYSEALAVVARLEATSLRVDPQSLATIEEALLG
jgi:hypothetical protein